MPVAPRFHLVIFFLLLSIAAKADPIIVTAGSNTSLISTSSTSISGAPRGFNWSPNPMDNFQSNNYVEKPLTSLLDVTLFKQLGVREQNFAAYSLLSSGQGGLATLSFSGTTNGLISLPLASFLVGSVYTGVVNKTGNNTNFIPSNVGPTTSFSIPEPATLLLLGSGLAALGVKIRKRKSYF